VNVSVLAKLKVGDIFETASMMPAISDEPIVWRVRSFRKNARQLPTVHFDLFWFDTRIASLEGEATSSDQIAWTKKVA